jgi:hypothetical protein
MTDASRRVVTLCLGWVIRVDLTGRRSLPVVPDKQTLSESVSMSQKCQEQTTYNGFPSRLLGRRE